MNKIDYVLAILQILSFVISTTRYKKHVITSFLQGYPVINIYNQENMRRLTSLQNQQQIKRNLTNLKYVMIYVTLQEQTVEEILLYLLYCFGKSAIKGDLDSRYNLAHNNSFQVVSINIYLKLESILNVIKINKRILLQISLMFLRVNKSNKVIQLFRLMLEMGITSKVIMNQNYDLEIALSNYVNQVQQQLYFYYLFQIKVEPFMLCNPKMIYQDLFYD
ncbi:hypothetical protein ABPG72_013972 [Tetrahymena utriculariae]